MRGKIVVGLVALLALVGLVANIWFVSNRAPADQRFNLQRQAIAAGVNPALLLPERIGDFVRQTLKPVEANANGDLEGSAAYADTDGKLIVFSVRKPGRGIPTLESLTTSQYTLHADAEFPFGYNEANGATFVWINSGWVITASTTEATSEALLQFANGCAF